MCPTKINFFYMFQLYKRLLWHQANKDKQIWFTRFDFEVVGPRLSSFCQLHYLGHWLIHLTWKLDNIFSNYCKGAYERPKIRNHLKTKPGYGLSQHSWRLPGPLLPHLRLWRLSTPYLRGPAAKRRPNGWLYTWWRENCYPSSWVWSVV